MAALHHENILQLLGRLAERLPAGQAQVLASMVAGLSEQEAAWLGDRLREQLASIDRAVAAFLTTECARPLRSQDQLPGWIVTPVPDAESMVLVALYLLHWQADVFWERILKGGIAGYSLYLHEWAELQWFLAQPSSSILNPFRAFEQGRGYGDAHATALLLEHRYLQVRAQEDGRVLTLRELIEANPHTTDGRGDWLYVEEYLAESQLPLDSAERGIDRLDEARQWYMDRAVRPVLLSLDDASPSEGR